MKNLKYTGVVLLICCSCISFSQNRNNIWCFGDSAGIDFNNLSSPVVIASGMNSRGTCATIADASGNLLFIAAGCPDKVVIGNLLSGKIYDKFSQIMLGGDSVVTGAWYNEQVIVPYPNDSNLYYVFSVGVTSVYGTYYSIVDLSQNSGLGGVTQKNIQLRPFACDDGINAIKHGNGRDWWLIFRKSGLSPGIPNNNFFRYLISPSGISNGMVQAVGSINSVNSGKITFSPSGDKMIYNNRAGLLEIFDFDRCTGLLNNPTTIFPQQLNPPRLFWGCEFSPNGNLLYVTISDQTSYLFQFDLTAPNIAGSIDTLWQTNFPGEAIGGLKRGPDGKIYESGPYTNPTVFVYPYPDSMRNVYNENLGVINSPDILGLGCDFQPYSFYLGGKRTYWGLPNNPDYDMTALVGSLCDSLTTGLQGNEYEIQKPELFVNFITEWQKAFINAQNLKGTKYYLRVHDMLGNTVFKEQGNLQPPYFTKDLNCSNFSKGMYIVTLQTDKELLSKKFIME